MVSEATQSYLESLQQLGWQIDDSLRQRLDSICIETDWNSPSTGQDWNNIGVAALIQAQDCDDLSLKMSLVELAQDAFSEGEADYLLCQAHKALLSVLVGEFYPARQQAFTALLQLQIALEKDAAEVPLGLIYVPTGWYGRAVDRLQVMELLYVSPQNGLEQVYQYWNQIFVHSAQVFYNAMGLHTLSTAAHVNPNLPALQLKQGIACRMAAQAEGFIYLHNALRLAPGNLTVLQSLSIAYRDINETAAAHHYWQLAADRSAGRLDFDSVWTQVSPDRDFTYVPFDEGVTLAVQPSLNSIVTSVLLGEGDWFESEMEFWRSWLKPGMTVIDVGANAGVYTFSAATRVGASGKVIAIEPFPACVGYLEETCRVNQFDWVRVYGAAASDRTGSIRLSIYGASELNEVIADDAEVVSGQVVEVPCLTLDSLIETEQMSAVNFLKLDAEGHEISVLRGAQRLLAEFSPIILYENIAGSQGSNMEVARFLVEQGYELNIYQPYLQQLIKLESLDALEGQLNVVATPST
ncbi:FkbM family methyltransferase [Altericista sp. CCNU0014]|uniref:FkbM family methyltransferase n=1 Tax=Altericista sp. CCNU0014 TaxID=3082949 RepID=UPI00385006AD